MASLDTVQNTHLQLQSLNVVKLHPILWKQCSLEVLYRVQLIKKRIEHLTLWCVYICLMRHLSSDSLPRISLTGSRVSLSLSLSELIVTSSLLCLQRRAPSVNLTRLNADESLKHCHAFPSNCWVCFTHTHTASSLHFPLKAHGRHRLAKAVFPALCEHPASQAPGGFLPLPAEAHQA